MSKKEPSIFQLGYMYDAGVKDGQEELLKYLNKEFTRIMTEEYEGKDRPGAILDLVNIVRTARPLKINK